MTLTNKSNDINENLKNKLKETLNKTILEKRIQNKLDDYEPFSNKFNEATSSARLAISTKNKLKNLMKSSESFNDVINRLINENNEYNHQIEYFKKLEKENKNLINYSEDTYKRVNKIYRYHPDLQIEYSYNEYKFKTEKNYIFDLHIDGYIYQGSSISEKEAISIIQTISIVRLVRKITYMKNLDKLIQEKKTLLDNPFEIVKTKYVIYFKILYSILNDNISTFQREDVFLDEIFWKNVYERKSISEESFNNDVENKLRKYAAEIKQIEINADRKMWNFKLK